MFSTEFNTPADEINHRITRLQSELQKHAIEAALILQHADLFYFSGTIQQCHLIIPAADPAILMVRKSYERALAESALSQIVPLSNPKEIKKIMNSRGLISPRRLGMELDVVPANLYLQYTRIFDQAEIVDISTLIRSIRAIKSKYEQKIIAEASRRADQVAAQVSQILKPGLTEIELAGQVEAFARKLGHQGIIRMRLWENELFYGHLMSGASAAVPSYLASPTGGSATSPAVAQGPSFKPISCHEPILIDYVFALNGYMADHTRIFSIGQLPDNLIKAHEAMRHVQTEIAGFAKPGVRAGEVYEKAVYLAAEAGYADNFMGADKQRVRFVGHGIGLELDEYPFLARGQGMVLEKGMVIALEPKCIFPGKGVVGVENTYVIGKAGLEKQTTYPDAVTVIEIT